MFTTKDVVVLPDKLRSIRLALGLDEDEVRSADL